MSQLILSAVLPILATWVASSEVMARLKWLKANTAGEFVYHFLVGGLRNVLAEKPEEDITVKAAPVTPTPTPRVDAPAQAVSP